MQTNKMDSHIFVLDDDICILNLVSEALKLQGYKVTSSTNIEQAKLFFSSKENQESVKLVITDFRLHESNGLAFIEHLNQQMIFLPFIIMTAYITTDIAVKATKLHAFDLLKKPFDLDELYSAVKNALVQFESKTMNVSPQRQSSNLLITQSSNIMMKSIFEMIKKISHTRSTVLITGESGSGKEMIAKLTHESSVYAERPFVAINCASIPEQLLESELFGHTKGSFTGAHVNRKGLFQEADEGTIFLDEIGDMSLMLQTKLLRVLQDKKIKAVGENFYKQINVRIIAATHRDLKESIKNGLFREDLFYRLNVIPIHVPSLRERREDIPSLSKYFLKKYSKIYNGKAKSFSAAAEDKLCHYNWPGNVRELENAIERAVIISNEGLIEPEDLQIVSENTELAAKVSSNSTYLPLNTIMLNYISYILSKTGGRKEEAANILKIDRATLRRKISESGMVISKDKTTPSYFMESFNFLEN
jgi:DNA-binding NtrC family response regulator